MDSYIIEITTFKLQNEVDMEAFWSGDIKIEANYTSKQPGYISRESAYNDTTSEVLVVVKWKNNEAAKTSMGKFMTDTSVSSYVSMIDGSTMKMNRYQVK